jgi:hypothetical protein
MLDDKKELEEYISYNTIYKELEKIQYIACYIYWMFFNYTYIHFAYR